MSQLMLTSTSRAGFSAYGNYMGELSRMNWSDLLASPRSLPVLSMHNYTDRQLPVDQIPDYGDGSLYAQCNCTRTGWQDASQPFFLNTGIAEHEGQLYVAVLRRIMIRKAKLAYPDGSKYKVSTMEANDIVLCRTEKGLPNLFDCELIKPGKGYKEEHVRKPSYELYGMTDPRLFVARGSLFLQVSCRPKQYKREAPCFMRLLGPKDDEGGWPLRVIVPVTETRPNNAWEKNWAPFEPLPGSEDHSKYGVLWSRTLLPHAVISLHPTNNSLVTRYVTDSSPAFAHLEHVCGHGPRGNTNMVFLPKAVSGAEQDWYLGVMHYGPHHTAETLESPTARCAVYLNFWYLMETEPPYRIHEASMSPIPLVAQTNPVLDARGWSMGFISFPTGLHVDGQGQVTLTYGTGDVEARVFSAPVREIMVTLASGAERLRRQRLEAMEAAAAEAHGLG